MGAMFASPQDNPVDRVFVKLQQACSGSHAYPFGRMVNNLSDRLGRKMQTKQGAGLGGSKALAAGATIKQIASFVLAILAANGDDTLYLPRIYLK
jgi:hypothetical protein